MVEGKKSFICYNEWLEHFQFFTYEEIGRLMEAIFIFSTTGELPNFTDRSLNVVFNLMKCQLVRDGTSWTDTRIARSEAGKKGAEARWGKNEGQPEETPQNAEMANYGKNGNVWQNMANMAVNVNGNANVNVNDTHTTEDEPQTVDNSNATEVAGACACDNLQKNITSVLEEHNKTVSSNKQKVPFTPKKISQMISNLPQKDSPETILKALNNYLLVAKHDGWKKTFSLSNFAKEYQDYTPEYFDTERYFKSPPYLMQNAEKPPDKKLLSWFICKNCGAVHALDEPSCPNCGSKNREIATGETYPDTYDKAG